MPPKQKMSKWLKEYRIHFEEVPKGENAYYISEAELGTCSKLGGKPDWDQADETPICSGCRKPMRFIAQIDSMEHHGNRNPNRKMFHDQEYMFGDVGKLYLFFCFDCMETKSVFQCG